MGGITGIRSTAGLRQIFDHSAAVKTLCYLESVGDKLPFIPARTQAMSLLARAGFGGFAASRLADEKSKRIIYGVIGAVSAVACTYAATQIRTKLGERSRLTSALLGFAEDGIVTWAERNLRAA